MDRYNRQTILPEIGARGQERLAQARVLVIGAGGLGCPALIYLAGAGIGTIGIIDFDTVDISNLQRQILFTPHDQGRPKAEVAAARLREFNPDITVHAYHEELTDKNAVSLFSGYDIIIDGTDNFSAKYLINDTAVKLERTVIYGAIQGYDGQVSVFAPHEGTPCYRCLYPQPPQGIVLNCAEAGVLGSVAGMIGTLQATETIKAILGHPSLETLAGRLWTINLKTAEMQIFSFARRADCPVCSRAAEDISLAYASPACSAATIVSEISPQDLRTIPDSVLVDVRELGEWETGHIPNARHLPLSALQHNPELFSSVKGVSNVLYCQRGGRSRTAAEILLRAGYTDIYSLQGGYEAWSRKA